MWFAWTILGLAQIWTGRYLVHLWKWRLFFHSVLGGLSGFLTLAAAIIILTWNPLSWHFYWDHVHNVAGIVCAVLGLLLVLGGIFALTMRRLVNNDWKTRQMLMMTKGHKIFGYFMVIVVQVAVVSGINRYQTIQPVQNYAMKQGLICGNVFFWALAIAIGEFLLWKRKRTFVEWKTVQETMNREQFDIAIQNNIPLILLDNLVLNVGGFIDQHPGGRFVIQHNLGHDISKYFYGGYCLEDNTGPIPA